MLQKMRQQSQSAIIILLFGFIIFVFVFSFGSGSQGFRAGGCSRTGEAVRVNGEPVTDMDFKYHYDMLLRSKMSQLPGKRSLEQEDRAFLREQTMNLLVDNTLLRQAAHRLGLHVTDEERNQNIRNTPAFQDNNQRFNFQLYKAMVEGNLGTTLPAFEQMWRERMLANRMREVIQDTARATEDELKHTYVNKNTKIDLSYVKVSSSAFLKEISPSQSEIDGFLKDQMSRVEASYQAQSDRFHKPKRVRAAHILFFVGKGYDTEQVADKEEQAQFTLEDLQKGADFKEQAKRYSEDDDTREQSGELTFMTQGAMAGRWGTLFAEAAFNLPKGQISDIVKSDKGFHLIKTLDIIEAEDHPLEEVKTTLAKEIFKQKQAIQLAKKEAERIFEALKSGKKIAEVVPASPDQTPDAYTKEDKKLQSDRTGLFPQRAGYIPQIGSHEEMARAAFELTDEKPLPDKIFEIQSSAGLAVYVVFSLAKRVDADLDTLPDATQNLRDQVLRSRRMLQLQAWLQHERIRSAIEPNPAFMNEIVQSGYRSQPR